MIKKCFCVLCALIVCFNLFCSQAYAENTNVVFSKGSGKEKKIALTFDDGPHPRYTKEILNILEKFDVKATFFVIGVNIENYPEDLKRIYNAGHEIGNHSYDHSILNSEKEILEQEFDKCEKLIYDNTGTTPTLFRPPQGKMNCDITNIAIKKGYSLILWSIDTRDWEHNAPNNILKTVNENISNGDIILMHDYTSGKNTTCDALNLIIPALKQKGYEFVTVSELLNS